MSMMCSLKGECTQNKGLCVHEKMMLVIIVLIGVGAMGHWVFNWF